MLLSTQLLRLNMLIITDLETCPESLVIGCNFNSSLRVEVGPLQRACSIVQSTFAKTGFNIPIDSGFVGLVVILDGKEKLGLFYPKLGTVWFGQKDSDDMSFASRFTKGGDLAHDYEDAVMSIFRFRMSGYSEIARSFDLSESDHNALKKAELKRRRKAQKYRNHLQTTCIN